MVEMKELYCNYILLLVLLVPNFLEVSLLLLYSLKINANFYLSIILLEEI